MPDSKTSQIPLSFERMSEADMSTQASNFLKQCQRRRTVRHFSDAPIPLGVVRECIAAAGTAPSGAHKQPWTFCLVTNPMVKKAIRDAAEKEEYANYHGRMSERWLKDLKPFETNHIKPHLEEAPALIVVFRHVWEPLTEALGGKTPNYYVQESVGLACGILLTGLQHAGLVALTHTPSPMGFLAEILKRPEHERAFLLIPVGFPAPGCTVPDIQRKELDEILIEID